MVPSIVDGTILVLDNPSSPSGPPAALVGVNPSTGAQSIISTGQLFNTPVDPREAHDEQIYVTDYYAFGTGSATNVGGAVFRIDPDTGKQSLLAKGGFINGPSALAAIHNKLYITDVGDDTGTYRNIVEINPNTGKQRLISSGGMLYNPLALVPGPGDNIYVLDEHALGTGALFEVSLATGRQTLLLTGGVLRFPIDLAQDPSGNLIVFNRDSATDFTVGAGSVLRLNPQTHVPTVISSGGLLSALDGGAVARDGTIYAGTTTTVPFTVPARIIAVNPVTGAQRIVTEGKDLDIVEGLTVFYNKPGGGDAAPGGPSSPVRPVGTAQVDNADLPASGMTSPSVLVTAGAQTSLVQFASQPLPVRVVGQESSWSLEPEAAHRGTTATAAVDSFFADLGSGLLSANLPLQGIR